MGVADVSHRLESPIVVADVNHPSTQKKLGLTSSQPSKTPNLPQIAANIIFGLPDNVTESEAEEHANRITSSLKATSRDSIHVQAVPYDEEEDYFDEQDEDWQESDETVEEQEDRSDQESEAEIIDHQTQ